MDYALLVFKGKMKSVDRYIPVCLAGVQLSSSSFVDILLWFCIVFYTLPTERLFTVHLFKRDILIRQYLSP